jgi:hypothetical protein
MSDLPGAPIRADGSHNDQRYLGSGTYSALKFITEEIPSDGIILYCSLANETFR